MQQTKSKLRKCISMHLRSQKKKKNKTKKSKMSNISVTLCNAQVISTIYKVFSSGYLIQKDTLDIFKVIQATISGLCVAKCTIPKTDKVCVEDIVINDPLQTMFLLYSLHEKDAFYFASQSIRDNYDDPIEYNKIVRHIVGLDHAEEKLLSVLGVSAPSETRESVKNVKVPKHFLLTDVELEKQRFVSSGTFSDQMMNQFRNNKTEDSVLTMLKFFGVPNELKEEYVKQLFSIQKTHTRVIEYILKVWELYTELHCKVSGIQKEGICNLLLDWFRDNKIQHDKIQEIETLKEFQVFRNNRTNKRKCNVSPEVEQLKRLNNKRRETIRQLQFELKQLKGETRRQRSCKICRKAAGVCTSRGKQGHLPSLPEEV